MAKKIEKNNFVYSTNPNFEFEYIEETIETLLPEKQLLKVLLDTKQRAGKKVTIIEGFIGNKEDLEDLGKKIKTKLGVGGTVKEGIVIIQGDYVAQSKKILQELKYKVR